MGNAQKYYFTLDRRMQESKRAQTDSCPHRNFSKANPKASRFPRYSPPVRFCALRLRFSLLRDQGFQLHKEPNALGI
ncbi:hypothetical protein CCACVL1_09925 [Corchorus capsularis]|uniref:Uncharacterized protein n=1 Tax=Corchorus capsularis TaxID=210143 RepID=A0A1R3ITN4_COCAP|nr:hypothetical protein CCACVL1_09925 [Corchorus capsularis]